jgi:hypothetical protein
LFLFNTRFKFQNQIKVSTKNQLFYAVTFHHSEDSVPLKDKGKKQIHPRFSDCFRYVTDDHRYVCPSSIYGFWLPHWYFQTLLSFDEYYNLLWLDRSGAHEIRANIPGPTTEIRANIPSPTTEIRANIPGLTTEIRANFPGYNQKIPYLASLTKSLITSPANVPTQWAQLILIVF